MKQPPISNEFVAEGCEQFSNPVSQPPIDSLIKKLEAKICGNYSEHEAYGRGLDSAFTVAIDIIRDHFASEICIITPEKLIEIMQFSGHPKYLDNPLTDSEKGLLRDALHYLRPYLATREPVTVDDCPACIHKKLSRQCVDMGIDPEKMLRQPEPVSVSLEKGAQAIAKEENYKAKAKACAQAWGLEYVD